MRHLERSFLVHLAQNDQVTSCAEGMHLVAVRVPDHQAVIAARKSLDTIQEYQARTISMHRAYARHFLQTLRRLPVEGRT